MRHGNKPGECAGSREDLQRLAAALAAEGGLVRTEPIAVPSNPTVSALLMDVGADLRPSVVHAPDGGRATVVEMPPALRHSCLVAMVQCSAWLVTHGLGFVDFKLENMAGVLKPGQNPLPTENLLEDTAGLLRPP